MPNFDHTGPEGMGSRSGRGMGQCMNRGSKARLAAQGGMGNTADPAQTPAPGMGQNMGPDAGQGRCCRHGQRQNNRSRNCGMGQGMRQGMRQGMEKNMAPASPAASCPPAGSDGADNYS